MDSMEERTGEIWRKGLKIGAVFACAALLAVCFWPLVRDALGIFFGACMLAFLLLPLAKLFEKKLPRAAASVLALALSALVLAACLVFLTPVVLKQTRDAAALLPNVLEKLKILADSAQRGLAAQLPGLTLPEIDLAGKQQELAGFAKSAATAVSSFASAAYRFALAAALSCFFMADRDRMLLRLELAIPCAWRKNAVRAGNEILRELRLYLKGQATIALAVGALATAGLLIIGVSGAPLLGLIVGIFNVIPYLGPIIGGIPAVVIALSRSWQLALLTVAVLFLVQQIDGLVISPRVMGNITGFSPATVLITLFLAAQAGGMWGMLLALPAMMTMRTLYRVFVQRKEKD